MIDQWDEHNKDAGRHPTATTFEKDKHFGLVRPGYIKNKI